MYKTGDLYREPTSNLGKFGNLIAVADTRKELEELCRKALETIQVRTEAQNGTSDRESLLMTEIRIGNEHTGYVRLGGKNPCAVIAEVGINHDGSVERALELVALAKASGADMVKFQFLDPAAMVHRPSLPAVYEIYDKYALSLEDMAEISRACAKHRIPFVCTVFDPEGAARMVEAGVSAFKIASCDMTHLPLLECLGQYGLPVILSTGLADLEEVRAERARSQARGGADSRAPSLRERLPRAGRVGQPLRDGYASA